MNLEEVFSLLSPSIVAFGSKLARGDVPPSFPSLIGTGFFIDERGIIATNRHVVEALMELPPHPKQGESSAFALVYSSVKQEGEGHALSAIMADIVRADMVDTLTMEDDADPYYGDPTPDIAFVQLKVRDVPALRLSTKEAHMPKIGRAIFVSILTVTSLFGQNNRSAVSLTGNDAATCTVPDPCRTFNVAISKTNPGGEVIVLSSAGYGPFTVTKSVSIISPPAYHAAMAPTSGDAITINVDNALVVLRGLTLNGSLGGVNGITFTGAATASNTRVYVENCVISGFSNRGVNFARNGTLFVSELVARENGYAAIFVDGNTGLPSWASIDHALMERNYYALLVENATVAMRDSVAAANSAGGFWALASLAGMSADLSADHCQATHNANSGFYSGDGSGTARLMVSNSVVSLNSLYGIGAGTNGTVRASNNTVTGNVYGLVQFSSGVFRSRGNNTVDCNGTETWGTITTFGPM
jgi:hypothetical protein